MKKTTLDKFRKEAESDLKASERRVNDAKAAYERATAELTAAGEEHKAAQELHQRFTGIAGSVEPTRRPGRPKGTTNAAAAKSAPKGKGGRKKATATAAPAKVKTKAKGKAAAATPTKRTRRSKSDGGLTMQDAMAQVMGTATMGAADIESALIKAGLAPKSNNLRAYISSVLSVSDRFVKVSRGQYRVKGTAGAKAPAAPKAKAEKAAEAAAPEEPKTEPAAPASAVPTADEVLSELGFTEPAQLS